jgi:hypothetical protein
MIAEAADFSMDGALPSLAIRCDFADHADFLAYAAQYRQAFHVFVGQHGREATTNAQQYEAARLSAIITVADPRFRMQYQHRDAAKNIVMVQALRYWRGYQDILPAAEEARRHAAYIRALPPIAHLRIQFATRRNRRREGIVPDGDLRYLPDQPTVGDESV